MRRHVRCCAHAVLQCAASAYGMLSAFLSNPRSQPRQYVIRAAFRAGPGSRTV